MRNIDVLLCCILYCLPFYFYDVAFPNYDRVLHRSWWQCRGWCTTGKQPKSNI